MPATHACELGSPHCDQCSREHAEAEFERRLLEMLVQFGQIA